MNLVQLMLLFIKEKVYELSAILKIICLQMVSEGILKFDA